MDSDEDSLSDSDAEDGHCPECGRECDEVVDGMCCICLDDDPEHNEWCEACRNRRSYSNSPDPAAGGYHVKTGVCAAGCPGDRKCRITHDMLDSFIRCVPGLARIDLY